MLHCYPAVNSFFRTINELLWNFSVEVQVKSHPVDTLNKVIIIINYYYYYYHYYYYRHHHHKVSIIIIIIIIIIIDIIINNYYYWMCMWTYCKAKCCRAFGQTGNDCRKKNNIMLTFYYNHNIKIWLQLAICSKVLLIIGNALTFIVSPSHLDFAEIWQCIIITEQNIKNSNYDSVTSNSLLFFQETPRPNPCTI